MKSIHLHMNMQEGASLLIQEKLDEAAAESCKAGWTWLWKAGFVLEVFFTAWTPSKYLSSDMHKPGVLYLCRASVVKCCPSSTAVPNHHRLLEGTASFQEASAGSQTCWGTLVHTKYTVNSDSTGATMIWRKKKKKGKSRLSLFTHPMYRNPEKHFPIATCS